MLHFETNIKLKWVVKTILRIIGLILCILFIFSPFRDLYRSFTRDGLVGYICCFTSIFVVFIMFIATYCFSLTGYFVYHLPWKYSPTILLSGCLFACNCTYAATDFALYFVSDPTMLYIYLYLCPTLYTILFIFWKYKSELQEISIKQFLWSNKVLLFGMVYQIFFPFLSNDISVNDFVNGNNLLIFILLGIHLYMNHISLFELMAGELPVTITLRIDRG